ncbi:MAG: putative sugar nucleotidyl transferase, partial [Saprospiraceae bacterium]
LLPFSYLRPVCDIRVGILTIRQKWEKYLGVKASFITAAYLSEKFPLVIEDDNLLIDGSVLPSAQLLPLIEKLDTNEALLHNGEILAARLTAEQFAELMSGKRPEHLTGYELKDTPIYQINHYWEILKIHDEAFLSDFALLTNDQESEDIPAGNVVIAPKNIFIAENVKIQGCSLNASTGPIYIGPGAEIMEGGFIRGAFALLDNALVKMGSKIYGTTTIGPNSKVAGEIKGSILFGNSNKAHDGFLGDSVLAEWCNLGAGTNNSNLKNNYAEVKLWDFTKERFVLSGSQFLGLFMGDHSKCAISTVFNTGTTVGICANIFGEGFPRNLIPSFAWGGKQGFSTYSQEKAFETIELVYARRGTKLEETERQILSNVFEASASQRFWEKRS